MSVYVMSLVTKSSVPFPERYTLLALADYANDDGMCWPSVGSLADWGQIGESTIRRHLRALSALQILNVDWRTDLSSVYTINLDRLKQMKRPPRSDSRQSGRGGQSGRGKERGPAKGDLDTSQTGRASQSDSGSQIEQSTPPNFDADPSQIGSQTTKEPSVDPSALFALEVDGEPAEPKPDPEAGFDAYWAVWPRKIAKLEARRCYRNALKRGATPEQILESAQRQVENWTAKGTPVEKIPHSTTWLNQGRYEDVVERPGLRLIKTASGSPWAADAEQHQIASPWAADMGWR